MNPSFTCDQCHGTFEKGWTDEEAAAEAAANFGDRLGDDPAVVCDDCFEQMTTALPIGDYLDPLAAIRRLVAEHEAAAAAKRTPFENLLHGKLKAALMERLMYGERAGLNPHG